MRCVIIEFYAQLISKSYVFKNNNLFINTFKFLINYCFVKHELFTKYKNRQF